MSNNFNIEIISPEKSIIKSETNEVTLPAYEGQIGILKDHIPLITFLRPGLISIKQNNNTKTFFAEDGIVEFSNNHLLVLSSTAKDLENLEKNIIEKIITESQEAVNNKDISDKDRYLLSYKISTLKEINL
tara:strand:- start:136 stop:528 length:393 start_codon:yes stop_codon:yes gene_type:complete